MGAEFTLGIGIYYLPVAGFCDMGECCGVFLDVFCELIFHATKLKPGRSLDCHSVRKCPSPFSFPSLQQFKKHMKAPPSSNRDL